MDKLWGYYMRVQQDTLMKSLKKLTMMTLKTMILGQNLKKAGLELEINIGQPQSLLLIRIIKEQFLKLQLMLSISFIELVILEILPEHHLERVYLLSV